MLKPYYQSVLDVLKAQLEANNFGTIDLSSFNISALIGGLGYFFVGLGLFLLIITILGCCGACCKVKFMLIAYAVIVIVILAGEIVFMGILYGSPDTVWTTEDFFYLSLHNKWPIRSTFINKGFEKLWVLALLMYVI